MPEEHGSIFRKFFHKAREYVGHWFAGGVIAFISGFGPEEWFNKLFEKLPEDVVRLWPRGWDLRLIPVTAGVVLIVGDVMWHRRRRREKGGDAMLPSPAPARERANLATAPAGAAAIQHEKSASIAPVLPRSIGDWFKGREDLLRRVQAALTAAPGGQSPIVALHGLGGVGKTRAAVEYARVHGKDYAPLLFARADSPQALRRDLAAHSATLALPEREATEEDVRLQAVLGWLRANPGWLLVLDNVDTRPALTETLRLLSGIDGGHVLMTSRLGNFPPDIVALEVDLLSPEAAEEFLRQRSPRRRHMAGDRAQARDLARDLGRLALALEHAGAFIDTRRTGFADYLDIWRNRRDRVIAWADPALTGYPRSIAETWQVSIEQLTDPGRHLLQRLAFLAPDPIPESLLDTAIPGSDSEDLREALADLAAYSLVTHDADAGQFSVHRLVQDTTQRSLDPATSRQRLTEALGWINAAFTGDPTDVRSWPRLDPLAPHAAVVAEHADRAGIADPTARLMNQLGLLFDTKSLHAQAEPLMRQAMKIDENSFGPHHPNVARDLNNLAQLLQATNRLAEAEPLMRRALVIDENSFGPHHPNVARDLNNLALLLRATNRLAEAEPLMRRALVIDENSFGPHHPNVAIDLNNLAQLLQATNRLAEAEPLMRRALVIDENSFGPDHPDVARDLNNLAQLLQATNRLAKAEPLMRRALTIDENSFGPDHPEVAIRLNNLAGLLQDTNRLAEAEPLMRRALVIDENSFGPHHPNVARDLNNLALLLQATNRLAEAEPLMRCALKISETSLGPDHPNVAIRLNNLALLLQDTNRLAEAEPLMRRALVIDENSFGPDHPEVATDLNNLAQLLQATNRLAEAEPLMRRAVDILCHFERTTGHRHPNCDIVEANYAALLAAMGRKQ